MTRPRIGEESESWQTGLCAYSDAPGEPHCSRDATWHGIKVAGPDGISMSSCDGHLPVVLALADYAHPLVHPCGIPGSLFSEAENKCYTDWDESAEFAVEVVKAAP